MVIMRFQLWLIIFKLQNNKAFRNDCLILLCFSKCFMFWLKALDLSKYFPHDYWLGKWNESQKEGTRYNTHFQLEVTKSNNIVGKWTVFFLHWNVLLNIMLNIKLTELGRQPLLGKILTWTFPRYHDSHRHFYF